MTPGHVAPLHLVPIRAGEPTLVFLHHFAGSGRAWAEVIDRLGPHRRCLALDLRGFGQSPASPAPSTVESQTDDVLRALQSAEVGAFVLVGHSMGGKIAWAVAARDPPGLRGLALLAPSPPTPEPIPDADRRERLAAFGQADAARALAGRLAGRPLTDSAVELLVEDSLRTSRQAWDGWLLRGSREDISAQRPPADLPSLVISGSSDPAIPTEVVRREVVRRLPGARLHVLQGVGHLLPFEAPDHVSGLIEAFGCRVDTPSRSAIHHGRELL